MEIRYEYHEPETVEEKIREREMLQSVFFSIFDAVLTRWRADSCCEKDGNGQATRGL